MAPQDKSKLTFEETDDLIYAARTDDLDFLQDFLPKKAADLGITEAEIIESTFDIDEEGLGSRSGLLHYPAANGKLKTVEYLVEKLGSSASQLNGAVDGHAPPAGFVNHQNLNGNTALHWAALNGHLEIVKALVKAGADPTIVNGAGKDAVVEAEYSAQPGADECATWLLKECDVLEKGAGGAQAQAADEEVEDVGETVNGDNAGAST